MSCVHQGLTLCAIACTVSLASCGGTSATVLEPEVNTSVLSDDAVQSTVSDSFVAHSTSGRPQDEPLDLINGPERDSSLSVDSRRFPLNAALGDIWGQQPDHYQVDFTVTNGRFVIEPTEINGTTYNLLEPVGATAVFYARMFSPGSSFSFMTYSFSSFGAGNGVLAGNAFFSDAYVSYDADNNGAVENDEQHAVIGGTVEFSGALPEIELMFNVTLENGLSATGHYTGLFDFTER